PFLRLALCNPFQDSSLCDCRRLRPAGCIRKELRLTPSITFARAPAEFASGGCQMNLELRRDQTGGRHRVVRLLVRAVTVAALLAGLGALGGALYGALCGLMFWGTHGDVLLFLGAITRCL